MIDRVALVLTAAIWILPAWTQTKSGSIEGQTVNLKTGAPLRDATVTLSGPYAKVVLSPGDAMVSPPVRVSSDAQGRFAFHNLAAGNYRLSAGRDGFQSVSYGESHVARELLPVGEGRQVKDVVLKLAPFGVIAGKVTDEAGVPLQNARITDYQYRAGAWIRTPQAGEPTQFGYTNDLGEYRVVLPPGPYVVSAAYPFQSALLEPAITPGLGHPTTYYPDALGPEHAQPLTVVSGETVKADFSLRKAPAYRIRGSLADSRGQAWGQACVGLLPKGSLPSNYLLVGSITANTQDGSFTIVAVPPGSYLLTAEMCGGASPVSGMQALEVSGDVDGLKVHMTSAQVVHGAVKVEGKVDLAGVTVYLRPMEFFGGAGPSATISGGGALAFERVLSLRYVTEFRGLPPNCYVKSVRYGGQEVAATGFQPAEGASLEITVSALRAAKLTGSVTDAAGRPVRYPRVTLIPSDGGPAVSAKDVMGDADGKFVFPALRPGKYRAAAWERMFQLTFLAADSRDLKLYRERSKVVQVKPGRPQAVALSLISAAEVDLARSTP